jgi:hypothetical protein
MAKVLKECAPPVQRACYTPDGVPAINPALAHQPLTLPELQRSQAPLPQMPLADSDEVAAPALPPNVSVAVTPGAAAPTHPPQK